MNVYCLDCHSTQDRKTLNECKPQVPVLRSHANDSAGRQKPPQKIPASVTVLVDVAGLLLASTGALACLHTLGGEASGWGERNAGVGEGGGEIGIMGLQKASPEELLWCMNCHVLEGKALPR